MGADFRETGAELGIFWGKGVGKEYITGFPVDNLTYLNLLE